MEFNIIDGVGLFGVAIIVCTYFLLQIEKIKSTSLYYSLFNVFGSALILFSIAFNWNTASAVIEIFWILISLIGVYKYFKTTQSLKT